MLELKRHNVAQIIISHRMNDIFEVGERAIAQASEKEVLELIVSGAP